MSTILAFRSKYHDSSEHMELFVAYPALKEAQEGKIRRIGLPSRKAHPDAARIRIQRAESALWDWVEIGLTVVLTLSVIVSTLLFLVTVGKT
jgi:hypothetical protein